MGVGIISLFLSTIVANLNCIVVRAFGPLLRFFFVLFYSTISSDL